MTDLVDQLRDSAQTSRRRLSTTSTTSAGIDSSSTRPSRSSSSARPCSLTATRCSSQAVTATSSATACCFSPASSTSRHRESRRSAPPRLASASTSSCRGRPRSRTRSRPRPPNATGRSISAPALTPTSPTHAAWRSPRPATPSARPSTADAEAITRARSRWARKSIEFREDKSLTDALSAFAYDLNPASDLTSKCPACGSPGMLRGRGDLRENAEGWWFVVEPFELWCRFCQLHLRDAAELRAAEIPARVGELADRGAYLDAERELRDEDEREQYMDDLWARYPDGEFDLDD